MGMEIKTLALSALAMLIIGAAGGFWYGYWQTKKDCDAERWKAEAETLRAALEKRDATVPIDREIARWSINSVVETVAEYAKIRKDYAARKKARTPKKNGPSEPAVFASVRPLVPIPFDHIGEFDHAPVCPVADDLHVSAELFGLYLDSYRPLLRTNP